MLKVFESGSGKWIQIVNGQVRYTSDEGYAEQFDLIGLKSAVDCFADFVIYKSTLFVVPLGSNTRPWEGKIVSVYLADIKEKISGRNV